MSNELAESKIDFIRWVKSYRKVVKQFRAMMEQHGEERVVAEYFRQNPGGDWEGQKQFFEYWGDVIDDITRTKTVVTMDALLVPDVVEGFKTSSTDFDYLPFDAFIMGLRGTGLCVVRRVHDAVHIALKNDDYEGGLDIYDDKGEQELVKCVTNAKGYYPYWADLVSSLAALSHVCKEYLPELKEIYSEKVSEREATKKKIASNWTQYSVKPLFMSKTKSVASAEGDGHVTPHIRRAHWHTYRTGKGRINSELKWLMPFVVGGEKAEKITYIEKLI